MSYSGRGYLVYKLYDTGGDWEDLIPVTGAPCLPGITIYYKPGIEGFVIRDGWIELFLPKPFTWQSIVIAIEDILGCDIAITTSDVAIKNT